ncbi:Uncharacterised protein [uncultured archaeon]|nr:Uncharacterised protein [uncultured archaeon]
MQENSMLRELEHAVKLLERAGMNYMIGGGIANSYWGFPRSTTDIDFIVPLHYKSDKDALQVVENELMKEGWEIKADEGRPLIAQKTVRLDFWSLKSLFDKERFDRRIRVKLEDFEIWITTPEDLIIQKLMWHRSKDIEDIKGILARQDKLDWDYLKKWARGLQLETELKSIGNPNR